MSRLGAHTVFALLAALLVLLLSGCGFRSILAPPDPAPAPGRPSSSLPASAQVLILQQQMDGAASRVQHAEAAQRLAAQQVKEAEAALAAAKAAAKDADRELSMARAARLRDRCFIIAGILAALSLGVVGIGAWLGVRGLVKAGLVGVALAAFTATVGLAASWLWMAAVGVSAATGGGLLFALLRMVVSRDVALGQVAAAVNDAKAALPDYKARFRVHIDKTSDRLLDGVRARWGLK